MTKCMVCGREKKYWQKPKFRCQMCMVKSYSTIFKEMEVDNNFAYWLVGFTDGEGNFQFIDGKGRSDAMYRIVLREDDKPILEDIRNSVGCGKLFYRDVQKNIKNWNPKYQSTKHRNQWVFKVGNCYDLVKRIIPLFDTYQLKSKKKKQYLMWRKNVLDKWDRICKRGIKVVV